MNIKFRKQLLKNEDGFTLIELMLVIVIIGILAGIAIPKMKDVKNDAVIAVAKSDLKVIRTGLERYYLDNGSYPESYDLDAIKDYISIDDLSEYKNDRLKLTEDDYNVAREVGEKVITLTLEKGIKVDNLGTDQ